MSKFNLEINDNFYLQTICSSFNDISLKDVESECEQLKYLWKGKHKKLFKLLNIIVPKTCLVVRPDESDRIIDTLLTSGGELYIPITNLIHIIMKKNMCLHNCINLFKLKRIKSIQLGYALTYNKFWCQHAWGIDINTNNIVETTDPMLGYLFVCNL